MFCFFAIVCIICYTSVLFSPFSLLFSVQIGKPNSGLCRCTFLFPFILLA